MTKKSRASGRKRNRKPGKTSKVQTPDHWSTTLRTRRGFLKVAAGGLFFASAATALHAYDTKHRTLYDLSTIGNGVPTIVQIHDPGCPVCRRLKGTVEGVVSSVDNVDLRLADITTAKGKKLQKKYDVPHVTLLFFNAAGEHIHTTRGLQTTSEINAVMHKVFGIATTG